MTDASQEPTFADVIDAAREAYGTALIANGEGLHASTLAIAIAGALVMRGYLSAEDIARQVRAADAAFADMADRIDAQHALKRDAEVLALLTKWEATANAIGTLATVGEGETVN